MEQDQHEPRSNAALPGPVPAATGPVATAGNDKPTTAIPNASGGPAPALRRQGLFPWLLIGLILLLLGVGSAGAYWFFSRNTLPPDPRLAYKGRYLNVRPEVTYVGDARCVTCHQEEAEHYAHHPMGQSIIPAADLAGSENLSPSVQNPFEFKNFRYEVIKRANTFWHKETMFTTDKKTVVYEQEMEVTHALGSGAHGKTYLIVSDGRVVESPISWYTEKARWDLSPNYHKNNLHFNRPVIPECLQCHSNHVVPIRETVNAYQLPLFRGNAIGCERCHGPGELHVRSRENGAAGPAPDYTIVNPKHLEPTLREAVCQQCHLQGEQRVQRLGRDIAEYRPGLPLHYFEAIFVQPPELIDERKAVGQVEQMALSACFQESQGKLGCISCHDPHRSPAPKEKNAFYRGRCLTCHDETTSCSETLPKRQKRDDNCVGCHMPSNTSSDIVHASITDHRILKDPILGLTKRPLPSADHLPLVDFHRELEDPAKVTRDRDLAIALAASTSSAKGNDLNSKIRSRLEQSLKRYPEDLQAAAMLARVLWRMGEHESAYRSIRQSLRQSPNNEQLLVVAGYFARNLGLVEEALPIQQHLVELDPSNAEYQANLANLLADKGLWQPALAATQAGIKLDPSRIGLRRLLITCYLGLGQRDAAWSAAKSYFLFEPPDREVVERWFD